jgi:hypothetical protein
MCFQSPRAILCWPGSGHISCHQFSLRPYSTQAFIDFGQGSMWSIQSKVGRVHTRKMLTQHSRTQFLFMSQQNTILCIRDMIYMYHKKICDHPRVGFRPHAVTMPTKSYTIMSTEDIVCCNGKKTIDLLSGL